MLKSGAVRDAMIDLSDFFPTMCEAAGISSPSNLDGFSMVPMFKGEKHARKWAYVWYARNGGATGKEFARTQRWKLYADGKFFDMDKDPEEKSPIPVNELSEKNIESHKMLLAALKKYENVRSEEVASANKKPSKKKDKKKKKK